MRRVLVSIALLVVLESACSGKSNGTSLVLPGSSSSAYCTLARQFLKDANPQQTGDLEASYARFDTEAPRVLAIAPGLIKEDYRTLIAGAKSLEVALAKVNYDPTKITSADLAILESSAFLNAAGNISAYDQQVCGLKS